MAIDLIVVLNSVLTLLFLIIIGFAARKLNIIDAALSKRLSNIVIVIGQPFLLIGALLNNEYSPELLKTGLTVIVIALAAHTILAVLAHVFTLAFKIPDERKILEFSMVFANCAFIGFPIIEAIFGSKGLFYGSFYVISFNIFMWSYGMIILGRNRKDIKISPLKMFVNYGTTPCIIGLVLYIWQLTPPSFFMNAATYLGSICTPLSTLVIGGLLATISIRDLLLSGKIYLFCFIKLLVLPTIVILIAKLFGLPEEMIYLAGIMSALPTAANTAMFAEIYDIKPSFAAQAVGMSTLLCVATIPAFLFIAQLIV